MQPIVKTKEEELLLRVFKLIKHNHFTDHKLSTEYVSSIKFNHKLGTDIGNYIHNKFPEYYNKERLININETLQG